MQISAANLLLAAQQARPAASPSGAGTGPAAAKPAARPFALPDLEGAAETAEMPADAPRKPAQQAPSAPAPIARANSQTGGYAALAAPGSKLNICV